MCFQSCQHTLGMFIMQFASSSSPKSGQFSEKAPRNRIVCIIHSAGSKINSCSSPTRLQSPARSHFWHSEFSEKDVLLCWTQRGVFSGKSQQLPNLFFPGILLISPLISTHCQFSLSVRGNRNVHLDALTSSGTRFSNWSVCSQPPSLANWFWCASSIEDCLWAPGTIWVKGALWGQLLLTCVCAWETFLFKGVSD